VLTVGCTTPEYVLSTLVSRQSGEVKLNNLRDKLFQGTLVASAPAGFDVSAKRTAVQLVPGERTTVPLEVTLTGDVPAGDHLIAINLLGHDGTLDTARTARIKHLGRREQIVLHPVEDTYASQRYPDRNRGSVDVLLVDGGETKTADLGHNVAYLKFVVRVPGKPLRAKLRMHHTGSGADSSESGCGRVCLVDEPWQEAQVTYQMQPKLGREIARRGHVADDNVIEWPLAVVPQNHDTLSLAVDSTDLEGAEYLSRESDRPPELIIEYEPSPRTASRAKAK
jgi:hypothetical protein